MFRQIISITQRLASLDVAATANQKCLRQQSLLFRNNQLQTSKIITTTTTTSRRQYCRNYSIQNSNSYKQCNILGISTLCSGDKLNHCLPTTDSRNTIISRREFHAAGSKVNYLDFRHRLKTNHLRLHLLIIRRQKMKKHKRMKFRKKFKCLLAKQRLKREIAKEKAFRVELLTMIRRAESFDPREYALRKIAEVHNKPKELSKQEKWDSLKELIRVNRYQVDYIKPKHRRADI